MEFSNPIGIMQGRLSPPAEGRIQSFPVKTWRNEFDLARLAGLDCIEWIYETETESENPISTKNGIAEILRRQEETGVMIRSVCADYFMKERLVSTKGEKRDSAIEHLIWLINQLGMLSMQYIVLPFVDESSLRSPREIDGLLAVLQSVSPAARQAGIELHLETDLNLPDLLKVFTSVSDPYIRTNYDIGNSASLGHDPGEELAMLGSYLGSVHVKDRLLGGGSVPLGTGAADFTICFKLFRQAGYRRAYILQAAREEGLSELKLAIKNRKFVEKLLIETEE